MKVYEYLQSVPDEEIASSLREEYDHLKSESINRMLAAKQRIIQSIQIKEDIAGIRIERTDYVAGDGQYWDVYGVLENGEDVGIEFCPVGVITPLEVTPDPGLTDAQIAALLLHELTFMGDEESKISKMHNIDDIMQEGPVEELSKGVFISEQVKAAMEKNPELKRMLENLSVDDVKSAGRRIRKD